MDSINTDLFGNPYVALRGGVNQFMEPQFKLDDAHANYAAGLQSGMRVSLICIGGGDVAKTPMSKDWHPSQLSWKISTLAVYRYWLEAIQPVRVWH